jgi:beta-phosphoglucomutase-like phosphatase (HAD superfamily)
MIATSVSKASQSPDRRAPPRRVRRQEQQPSERSLGPLRTETFELETASSHWQLALDAAESALAAAANALPGTELTQRRRALIRERDRDVAALARLGTTTRVQPAPWLSPVPVARHMLGLPDVVGACLFDLDGVLTDSGLLHAEAWGETFDAFLLASSEQTGWQFIPFDRDSDYRNYVDGRTRIEGVHAFLASRGIQIPEGTAADTADRPSAYGLAARKIEAFEHVLANKGVVPLPGVWRYLQSAGRAGLRRGVMSASERTAAIVQLAHLGPLVETSIDAQAMRREELRSRPAPDTLVSACRRLEIDPAATVSITHSVGGVAAARAAGAGVIGVAAEPRAELLRRAGADRIVPNLRSLLDPRLTAP